MKLAIEEIIEPSERTLILIMGTKAVGKSTLAKALAGGYSANGFDRCLTIAWDPNGPEACRPIRALFPDSAKPWEWWKKFSESWFKDIQKQLPDIFGLIFDDATSASNRLLHNVINDGKNRGSSDSEQANIKEYGVCIERLRLMMEWLKYQSPWPCNIVCVNERIMTDGDGNIILRSPNVVGKDTFALELPAMATHMIYVLPPEQEKKRWNKESKKMEVVPGSASRLVLTAPDKELMAGNRVNTITEITLEVRESVSLEDLGNFRRKLFPHDEENNPISVGSGNRGR